MWQTLPCGLQDIGLRQMPIVLPDSITHVTLPAPGKPESGSPPQQSSSRRQRSPSTWQPLAGWQMSRPVGPGAQRRLQQRLQSAHVMPSTPSHRAGPSGTAAQSPTGEPLALTHSAVQQSVSRVQMSPG
jgi:hypothetical protein